MTDQKCKKCGCKLPPAGVCFRHICPEDSKILNAPPFEVKSNFNKPEQGVDERINEIFNLRPIAIAKVKNAVYNLILTERLAVVAEAKRILNLPEYQKQDDHICPDRIEEKLDALKSRIENNSGIEISPLDCP